MFIRPSEGWDAKLDEIVGARVDRNLADIEVCWNFIGVQIDNLRPKWRMFRVFLKCGNEIKISFSEFLGIKISP